MAQGLNCGQAVAEERAALAHQLACQVPACGRHTTAGAPIGPNVAHRAHLQQGRVSAAQGFLFTSQLPSATSNTTYARAAVLSELTLPRLETKLRQKAMHLNTHQRKTNPLCPWANLTPIAKTRVTAA